MLKQLISQSKKNIEIIRECIQIINESQDTVSVLIERALIESIIKLGEAQTFLCQDKLFLNDLKTLRQGEHKDFTVIQGCIYYRNKLTHHYPYNRYLGDMTYLAKSFEFIKKYIAPFEEKLNQLSKAIVTNETSIVLTKEKKTPRFGERKYSIADYPSFMFAFCGKTPIFVE